MIKRSLVAALGVFFAFMLYQRISRQRDSSSSGSVVSKSAINPIIISEANEKTAEYVPARTPLGQEKHVEQLYQAVVPTAHDIRRIRGLISSLVERTNGELHFTRDEAEALTQEVARMSVVNNALQAERARVEMTGDGTIIVNIAPDPDTAIEFANLSRERLAALIGSEKAEDTYKYMGPSLFSYFHGYGLGTEVITVSRSSSVGNAYDFSYSLVLTSAHRAEIPYIFDAKGGDMSSRTIGVSRDTLFDSLEFGVLRLLLKDRL